MKKNKSKKLKIIFYIIGAVIVTITGIALMIYVTPYAKEMRTDKNLVGGEVLIAPLLLMIYTSAIMIFNDIKAGLFRWRDEKYEIKVNKGDKI